jgi:hypothetical protein
VIEALKFIQKARELKLYKRPEIIDAIKRLSSDFGALSQLQP